MTDENATYCSGGAAENEVVVALPPLVLLSCPLIVPPSHCAGWLLPGLRLMMPPTSNATAAGLYCPPQPPPMLPLLLGCHCHHCNHHGQTHCCPLPKKEHLYQCTNGSTNLKTFTSQTTWTYSTYLQYFEVCDVGQGNLAISKLFHSILSKCGCNLDF
jgi:hypothetical protein